MVWNTCAIKRAYYTNSVFTNLAFGTSHTYSHLCRTPPPPPPEISAARRGASSRAPHLRTPCSRVKTFFIIIFFKDQPKQTAKTDGNSDLAGGPLDFLATPLNIASSDKYNFIQAIGSLIVETVHK